MATKVFTTDLRVGMFVADLDRPWVDTPFLLQGFVIEDAEQIAALQQHCEYVIVDRARSLGDQFEAAPSGGAAAQHAAADATLRATAAARPSRAGTRPVEPPATAGKATPKLKMIRLEEVSRGGGGRAGGSLASDDDSEDSMFGRVFGGLKGMLGGGARKQPVPSRPPPPPEPQPETPQEFEARASLLPPGTQVQTYQNVVTVEEEAPRAREVVTQASDLLEKLVQDIRLGQSFEVERVEEIVDDMVDSIVRNPQALMWVAKLREQDITAYGHGLQVSVYLTSFGRHLGFPRAQLSQLAQVGLLLDIGKIRLPRELLQKQGRLTDGEFESAKEHVQHGVQILKETPNFSRDVLSGIEQHHERMNGSGYPRGLVGEEIAIFGRMAGIVDCFAALTNHRPYAAAVSSYEALRSIAAWGGEYFHEPLVQQFVSSVGVFPVGSLIELNTGEVAIVVEHSKVRRLKPRVLIVTGPDKQPVGYPAMLDLLYNPKRGGDEAAFIKRGLAPGAYGLDLKDFYLA
jgi:HD-GYP domain-containing protein (c-di-GMP phosphodiesterase class II)